ncbi:MAG: hypothetical protein JXP73_08635 [Deltaproteobacteria bacterium]|jgi:hypothetical protein|nr:hypothetical protein [Deltaproteobacteria bacterium]
MAIRGSHAAAQESGSRIVCLPGLLLAAFGLALAGCASATVGNQGGSGGAASGGTSGSGGSTGSGGFAGGSGGAGGAGGTSTSSTGMCDPFSDAGCASEKKCTALQQSATSLVLGCGDIEGTKSEGDGCTQTTTDGKQTGDDCDRGLACFGAPATCHRMCSPGSATNDCPSGQICNLSAPGLTAVRFCQDVTTCLPLEQTGCDEGWACYYASSGALCAPEGDKRPGEDCTNANDCVRGSTCLVVEGKGICSSFCSTEEGGSPSCTGADTGGEICNPLAGGSDIEDHLGSCRQQP